MASKCWPEALRHLPNSENKELAQSPNRPIELAAQNEKIRMSTKLSTQSYGKSQVRLSRVARTASAHEFIEVSVDISLSGDFDVAYTDGNNAPVIPTDTMKNTVYALAKKQGIASCESFAILLAEHFNTQFDHVKTATVSVTEYPWNRIALDGNDHAHAFTGGGSEHQTATAVATAAITTLRSGLAGLQVLKTTESAFTGFLKDQFTTLPEATDRIFATTITAHWPCNELAADWTSHRQALRSTMLRVFAENFSPSVQKTLFEMAAAIFAQTAAIDEISISMPNQHHLLANLKPLGLENDNDIFVPTAQPFGMIAATVRRDGSQA